MVAVGIDGGTDQGGGSGQEPGASAAFRARALEVFGRRRESLQLAQEDASRLWLAWRGDSSYLIAALADRVERESSWRVVGYTDLPELCGRHDYVRAQSLEAELPEHVLARLMRFVLEQLDRAPGADVRVSDAGNEGAPEPPSSLSWRRTYGSLKEGKVLTVQWPSKGAPGLSLRTIALSKSWLEDAKYPGLDRVASPGPGSHAFTRFLEQAERKRQKRWLRRAARG